MLRPLVATIEKSVKRMKPTHEGDAQFIVREQDEESKLSSEQDTACPGELVCHVTLRL
jgi:hypothetical protein